MPGQLPVLPGLPLPLPGAAAPPLLNPGGLLLPAAAPGLVPMNLATPAPGLVMNNPGLGLGPVGGQNLGQNLGQPPPGQDMNRKSLLGPPPKSSASSTAQSSFVSSAVNTQGNFNQEGQGFNNKNMKPNPSPFGFGNNQQQPLTFSQNNPQGSSLDFSKPPPGFGGSQNDKTGNLMAMAMSDGPKDKPFGNRGNRNEGRSFQNRNQEQSSFTPNKQF